MNRTISSLSLSAYDILAVITPGLVLLYYIFSLTFDFPSNFTHSFLHTFLFMILSYVTGLLWKQFMDWLFSDLRNNPKELLDTYKESLLHKEDKNEQTGNGKNEKLDISNINDCYLSAYYSLEKEDALKVVHILEAQIALVRNIIILLPMIAGLLINRHVINTLSPCICVVCECDNSSYSKLLLFILLSAPLLAIGCYWLKRAQTKVYCLIWESYYYYNHKANIELSSLDQKEEKKRKCHCQSICKLVLVILSIALGYFIAF